MFVFNRSALAVLLPLALLVAVVFWSNRDTRPISPAADVVTVDHVTAVAQAVRPGQKGG